MKASIKEIEKTAFEPFELNIKIETVEDFVEVFARFNIIAGQGVIEDFKPVSLKGINIPIIRSVVFDILNKKLESYLKNSLA